ncbi:hypothetical protein EAI_02347, partial [Harpegnathos saltator]
SDRYVILSANGDGITLILEMMQVLNKMHSTHDWRPRRSLIFCVSLVPLDVCPQTLSDFLRRKVVAYVAIHGHFLQADRYVTLPGSDVVQSIAIEAIKTSESNLTRNQIHHDQNLRLHGVSLMQMVSQTIWRLSESIIMKWEPRYFNETVNKVLESIDKFPSTIGMTLHVRIWNDLILDLDRALLCPDKSFHSKTDLAILRKLSVESTSDTLNYLDNMIKCYEDAIQVLQE